MSVRDSNTVVGWSATYSRSIRCCTAGMRLETRRNHALFTILRAEPAYDSLPIPLKIAGNRFPTFAPIPIAPGVGFQFPSARMKSLTEHLWFEVPHRRGYLRITDQVEALVRRSGVLEGLCLVNAMHITASVYINDNEKGLLHDLDAWLEELAPHEPLSRYRHNQTGEDNADAHLKRQVMGREVVVAITAGKLDLGTWEQIFYAEFDGKRRKRVLVKIIGE